jgi:hypothetical protein
MGLISLLGSITGSRGALAPAVAMSIVFAAGCGGDFRSTTGGSDAGPGMGGNPGGGSSNGGASGATDAGAGATSSGGSDTDGSVGDGGTGGTGGAGNGGRVGTGGRSHGNGGSAAGGAESGGASSGGSANGGASSGGTSSGGSANGGTSSGGAGTGGQGTGGGGSHQQNASDYAQSCNNDSDCRTEHEGDACGCDQCPNSAINVKDVSQWDADRKAFMCIPLPCVNNPCAPKLATCARSTCVARTPTYVVAENYDQVCTLDSDCKLIPLGEMCAACQCSQGAVSTSGYNKWKTDRAKVACTPPPVACACPAPAQPHCKFGSGTLLSGICSAG